MEQATQALAHQLEQLVTGAVAQRVVDRLEAVEVEQQQRVQFARAAVRLQRLAHVGQQPVAVGQPGQGVEPGQLKGLLLGVALGRHVELHGQVVGDLAL